MNKKRASIFICLAVIILALSLSLTTYMVMKNRSLASFKPEDFTVKLLSATIDKDPTHEESYNVKYVILIKDNTEKPVNIEAVGYFSKAIENLLGEKGYLPYLELCAKKFPLNAEMTNRIETTITSDIYEKYGDDFKDITMKLIINGRKELLYKLY
ncbi:MAG: hypothetical protein PWR06_2043 [Thermoanaerobacteraceae bacterium]|nr:hypothetical protein [Thermoanaerobacteraceae bacterium]